MSLGRETLACCGLLALLAAGGARAESASGESAAPAWLRAPSARGPLSSVLAYDSRWAYGSLAAGVGFGCIVIVMLKIEWPVRPGPDITRRFERPAPPHSTFPTTGMLMKLPRFDVNLPVSK